MSWLDRFFTGGIKNVAIAGTLLPQEVTLNFVSGATGVDNAAQSRSDVTINTLSTPTGTGFVHVTGGTVDAAARAVNVGSADVTGVLGTTNGGTGLSTVGSNTQVLTIVAGVPAWANNSASVTWANDLQGSTSSNQWIANISGSGGTGGTIQVGDGVHNVTFSAVVSLQATPPIITLSGSAGFTAAASNGSAGGAVQWLGGNGGAGTGTNKVGGVGGIAYVLGGNGGASTGTAANSNGADAVLGSGSPGTGGSGAAGVAGNVNLQIGGTTQVQIAGSGATITLTPGTLQWAAAVASPTISQLSTSAATGANLLLQSQASTASPGTPGNVVVNTLDKVGAGKIGYFEVDGATTNRLALIGSYNNNNASGAGCLWLGPIGSPSNTNYTVYGDGSTSALNAVTALDLLIGNGTQSCILNNSGFALLIGAANFHGGTNLLQLGQIIALPTATPSSSGYIWMNTGSPGTLGLCTVGIAFTNIVGAININQDAATTDVATTKLTIAAQSAWSSASTNINGANTVLGSGDAKTNGVSGLRGWSVMALGSAAPSYQLFFADVTTTRVGGFLFCSQNNTLSAGSNVLVIGTGTGPAAGAWNVGGQSAGIWNDGGQGGLRGIFQINNSTASSAHVSQVVAGGQALNAADPHTQVLNHQRIRSYGRTTTSAGTITTLLPAVPSACVREMRVTVVGRVAVAATGFVLDDSFGLYRVNYVVNHSGTAAQLGSLPAVLSTSSTASVSSSTVTFTFSTSHADVVVTAPASATPPTMDWTIDVEFLDN